jgi:DNA-binding transcriptional ArsR family regulator
MSIPTESSFVNSSYSSKTQQSLSNIRVGFNPHFTGKVAKDAPDTIWGAFNSSFQTEQLTLDGLAAHIQQGHALTAVCRGKRMADNFISRQELGLDFDTEDQQSTLDTLQAHPFIAQHATLLHTTSSHAAAAPRARVIFILERPVTDPNQYRAYAQALNWHFGASDAKCHDPARVWFGAIGCEVRKLGNVLPLAVLDELVTQWQAAQPEPPQTPTTPTTDALELLDQALRDGVAGNRNLAGFELAKGLRDNGYTIEAARVTMLDYQAAVEKLGNHPYLVREATDTLSSAYSHTPKIDGTLNALEQAVISGAIKLPANVLKSFIGILTIARKAGKTKNLALSLRSVEQACFGFVDKSSVANHLAVLVELGLLKLERKSNCRSGSQYSLTHAIVGHSHQLTPPTALSVQLLHVSAYQELQADPICAIGAQVHPMMARNDDEMHQSFASSAQRILAVLKAFGEVDSLETLKELTQLSMRTVVNKVAYLEAHQIIETARDGRRRTVKLSAFWRENIDAIGPALTSFGTDLLRAERAAQQQIAHHEHMAYRTANVDEKAMCEATIERAKQMIEFLQPHKTEAMNERRQWLQNEGLDPATAPPLSLHPRSNPKAKIKLCLGSDQTRSHLPKGSDKTKLKALRRMKQRLTPSEAAKVKRNGLTLVELAEVKASKPVATRIQLGDINSESFGSVCDVVA